MFTMFKKLGSGAFGTVYIAQFIKNGINFIIIYNYLRRILCTKIFIKTLTNYEKKTQICNF